MKNTIATRESSNRRGPPRPLAEIVAVYLLVFVAVLAVSVFIGSADWSPGEVWNLWRQDDPRFATWFALRVKRALFASSVGGVLALAGLVFQASLRNPLAEPYILGVSGGASLGAVSLAVLAPAAAWLGTTRGELTVTFFAFGGALLAVGLLLALARLGRLFDPASLILLGVVLNSIFLALILLYFSLVPEAQVKAGLLWTMGNISAEAVLDSPHLSCNLLVLAVGSAVFAAAARSLDLLSLSEEEAADLGMAPQRFRFATLGVASLMTGVVVASSGPIGFIGLVVPHIVRRLHGPSHRRLVPLSIVGGALFLLVADTFARTIHPTQPIPVGVITALTGGPFFLYLLVRVRRSLVHD